MGTTDDPRKAKSHKALVWPLKVDKDKKSILGYYIADSMYVSYTICMVLIEFENATVISAIPLSFKQSWFPTLVSKYGFLIYFIRVIGIFDFY